MSEISPLVRLVDDDDAFRESQKLFLPVFSPLYRAKSR